MQDNQYLFNSIDKKQKNNFGLIIRLVMGDFISIEHFSQQINFMFSEEKNVKNFQKSVFMSVCGLIKSEQATPLFLTTNIPIKKHYQKIYSFNNRQMAMKNDLNFA